MQLAREDKPAPLRNYRVFTLRDDDSTLRVALLNAASADDAIDQARRMVGEHPVELWSEDHMIARFAPIES